jgi:hypothetical protein
MAKKLSGKKPKIDLWEITGCAQIQEIEWPGVWAYLDFCSIKRLGTLLPLDGMLCYYWYPYSWVERSK